MTSTFDGNITTPRLYALCGVSTLIWSVYPTVIVLSGGSSSIWFQIALLSLSISCFFWFYLKKTNRYFVSKEAIKYGIKEIISNRGILFVQRFGLVGYLLVAAYADPAVAAVLMETWLMWY